MFSRLTDSNLALQHCREPWGWGGGGALSYAQTMTILDCTDNKSILYTESVKSTHFSALVTAGKVDFCMFF